MHLEEQDFIVLVKKNKELAYRYLVNSYGAAVFNASFNRVRNKEDAEDLTQEVFTTVYVSLDKFNGNSKLSTWIYAIALNKSKEFLRTKTRLKRSGSRVEIDNQELFMLPDQMVDFNHPGVKLEDKERARILFAAIDCLAENQRVAYTMHKIEGYSYEEVAEVLNVSVSPVESLMFRAKKRLNDLLEHYFNENERK